MTTPFVSSYEQAFLDAFGRGIEQLPKDRTALVKAIVDKIHEDVISQIESYVVDDMAAGAADALRQKAAEMASSMLGHALAGDDATIRTLFGFSEWYLKYPFHGHDMPTEWKLIDAIVARRPDIFLDERLKQRDKEIADLKAETERLRGRIEHLVNPPVEEV